MKGNPRTIKKLRKKCKYYDVQESKGLFGFIDRRSVLEKEIPFRGYKITVLARNPSEAVRRARKRGYYLDKSFNDDNSTRQWARFRVKKSDASNHWSNIIYLE